jgi:hypothetical protein
MKTIAELKALFAEKANAKSDENTGSNFDNYYPFWNMDIDAQAVIRFLPDANEENPLGFVTENISHVLYINGKKRKVPCLSMYGKKCPCCELSKQYYDAKDDVNGKKNYKKREYLSQAIVKSSPFEFDIGENPVKIVVLGIKLYKILQSAFMSGDLDEVPFAYKGGYDFRIIKSKQGEYADYTLSKFAPKQSDLEDDYVNAITLFDLSKFRTREITSDEMDALILADKTGNDYTDNKSDDDHDAFGTNNEPANLPSSETPKVDSTPVKEAAVPSSGQSSTANDILARIRAKTAAAAGK